MFWHTSGNLVVVCCVLWRQKQASVVRWQTKGAFRFFKPKPRMSHRKYLQERSEVRSMGCPIRKGRVSNVHVFLYIFEPTTALYLHHADRSFFSCGDGQEGEKKRWCAEFVPSGRTGMSRGRKAWLQPLQHPVFLWFGKFWLSDMCTCTAWDEGRSPTTTNVVLSSPDVGWQVYGEQTPQQVAACSLQMCGLAEALFCCTAGRGERVYAQPLASVVCKDDFWLSSRSLQTSFCALLGVWYPGLFLTASPWLNSREKWPNPSRVTHQWHRTATAHCKLLSWPQELSKALFCIHIICMKSLFCVILCASQ